MSETIWLNDSTSIWVDEQGFLFFGIDDGEDDAPFECGDIGLGYILDAVEEVWADPKESVDEFPVENNPKVFVSKFDDEIQITHTDDDNFWEVSANGKKLLQALRSFVVSE